MANAHQVIVHHRDDGRIELLEHVNMNTKIKQDFEDMSPDANVVGAQEFK
jgi:hypothetical protein